MIATKGLPEQRKPHWGEWLGTEWGDGVEDHHPARGV